VKFRAAYGNGEDSDHPRGVSRRGADINHRVNRCDIKVVGIQGVIVGSLSLIQLKQFSVEWFFITQEHGYFWSRSRDSQRKPRSVPDQQTSKPPISEAPSIWL